MFALIRNNKIEVGPRTWNYGFFREYIERNNLDISLLPFREPSEPIINLQFKILPVAVSSQPLDSLFEQPVGPTNIITENKVISIYEKTDKSIDSIKNGMKAKVADNRYAREIGGTDVNINGTTVRVYTDRDERNIFFVAFVLAQEDIIYPFKFPLSNDIFLNLSKANLQQIVDTIAFHVQDAFSWEARKKAEVDAAQTIEALKLINLQYS